MITTAAILHIWCKQAKLKALVTGIALQPIKGTDAIFSSINDSEIAHARHNGTQQQHKH